MEAFSYNDNRPFDETVMGEGAGERRANEGLVESWKWDGGILMVRWEVREVVAGNKWGGGR